MDHLRDSPTNIELAFRAMARWGDRVAFDGHGGRLTYRECLALIGRMQAVMTRLGLKRGEGIAVLHANRGDAWVAGLAANALGLRITPLHPLGSLADHLFILEDAEIIQPYVMLDGSGGFLLFRVVPTSEEEPPRIHFEFFDERGVPLYATMKRAR